MKKTFSLLLVIAMVVCLLPVFAVSAADSVLVPVAKTADGADVYGQPTEPNLKTWTVSDTGLSLNGGCDQGYYVFDNEVPAGKLTTTIKTNQASNSCNGIIFCLTDVDNDRAFWEGEDMVCYWLFLDENNKVRVSEVGKHGGNPGWRDIIPGEKQVDLDDMGIDVTAGVELTAEWDGAGLINVYVNGTLTNTIDDTESPLTGTLCGVRAKEQPASGCEFTSFVIKNYQTTNASGYYGNSANTGCGFLDGNMYPSAGLNAANSSELTVVVNGKTAYFNNGYLGEKHCAVREADYGENGKVPGGWIQIGVVGADVVPGINTLLVSDKDGNTVILNFKASINALGTSYAKVVGDAKAKTMKAEIVFNTDPGFEIGTTFEGRCHDDHGSTGVFTVTAYDSETKMYTIESTDYKTNQSLLELKVTSEGAYKDYYVSATINEYNAYVKSEIVGTKITITEATCNRNNKPGSNLIDGTVEKVEGNPPSESDPVVITFKTADAVKVNTLMLYTAGDDASYNNRAPGAFKLYGVAADGTKTLIKDVADSGMQNVNYAPFAVDIDATDAYSSYEMVITSMINGGAGSWWFQLGELEIYSDDASMVDVYEVKIGAVEYNGVDPVCKHNNTEVVGKVAATETEEGYTGDTVCSDCGEVVKKGKVTPVVKPAPTGDSVVALAVLAVVSLLGVAVFTKKRV